MIFTSRTYRHAIRRSIRRERDLRIRSDRIKQLHTWIAMRVLVNAQFNHTRRLQARKRKERK